MPTKTKTQPAKPKPVIEQIIDLVDKHIAATEAIMEDYAYITEVGMDTELKAANENLKSTVEEFTEPEPEELGFKELVKKVSEHDNFDPGPIVKMLKGADLEGFDEELIKLADTRALEDYFIGQGYACVKINNMIDRDKLEAFLHKEIYPAFNDQNSYIFL